MPVTIDGTSTAVIPDASGNVGIGTATPTTKMQIRQTNNTTTGGFSILSANGAQASVISELDNGTMTIRNAGVDSVTINNSGNFGVGTSAPGEKLTVYAASGYTAMSVYSGSANGRLFATSGEVGVQSVNSGDVLTFATNSGSGTIERGRFDASGNFLVGAQSIYYGIPGTYSTQNYVLGFAAGYWKLAIASTNFYFAYGAGGGSSDRAIINSSTGNYSAVSDRNKKKDFEDSTIGLDAVLKLKPTLFRMLEQPESEEKHLGFIAQDVKPIIPQAYVEQSGSAGDVFIGLEDRPIIAVLTKAIQELNAKVDALQAEINALKGAA